MLRRDFLRFAANSIVPITLPRTSRPKNILIAGAGLAGLSAAFELKRAGHRVTILEAQLRPGGRVQTLREPFSDGLHAEAGAVRIPADHNLTNHYIRLFGLPLEPFLPAGFDELYHLRGKRIRANKSAHWPLDLTAGERKLGLEGMWEKYVVDALRPYLKAPREPWPPPGLLPFDPLTLPELMRKRGASEAAIILMNIGFEVDRASSLWTLTDEISMRTAKTFSRIVGGNDRLPMAFATRLAADIRYGAPIREIRQTTAGVEVVCREGEAFHGDYLVCTIPPPVLKGVGNNFSAPVRHVMNTLRATPVTRVYIQTRKRFWLKDHFSGVAYTDQPVARIWPNANGRPEQRGILHTYTWGQPALNIDGLPADRRIATTLDQVDNIFPGTREQFEGGAWKGWAADPWARGAFAEFLPGEMAGFVKTLSEPDGRIYFAGEHASSWGGWMQGALQTGLRAAQAIHVR